MTIFDADLKQIVQLKDAGDRASTTSGFSNVAADGDGFIYATDNHSGEICKFSPDGKFLNRFTSHSNSPHGIAVDPKGRIFVAETSNIKVLDTNGNLLRELKSNQAFGVAFDQKGDLFVASRPYVIKYSLAF
jgi:DNA-binding beta-propeller fold protein YncE